MSVVAGEEEEWRQWQRETMGVVVLDDIDYDDCVGAMDGDYKHDNCDGAMDDYYDDDDDDTTTTTLMATAYLTTTTTTTTATITLSRRRLRIGDGNDTGSASSLVAGGRVIK